MARSFPLTVGEQYLCDQQSRIVVLIVPCCAGRPAPPPLAERFLDPALKLMFTAGTFDQAPDVLKVRACWGAAFRSNRRPRFFHDLTCWSRLSSLIDLMMRTTVSHESRRSANFTVSA